MWDLLPNPCTGILYAAVSSILYVLFEIKFVKCKLCESSSMFGGMNMLPRAVCSSTHYAWVVIRLWTSCMLMMTQIYFRMEQSPCSCFLCACAMHYFDVGKPATARQTSWAMLRTYSYCLALTSRHQPPQGRHPVSAMPGRPGG